MCIVGLGGVGIVGHIPAGMLRGLQTLQAIHTQTFLWHKGQKEKNEINHEAHKSQFPNRNRLLMMSLQPLLGCVRLEQQSARIRTEPNQLSREYPTLDPGCACRQPRSSLDKPSKRKGRKREMNKLAGSFPIPADLRKVN